jgi:hypothetical protein
MGVFNWLIKSNIKGTTKAMCRSLAMAGQMAKEGKIKNEKQDMLVWALSMRTPAWTKCGDYVFSHSCGAKVTVELDDNIKTITLKIILNELGAELVSNGFTKEEVYAIIDEEVKKYVRS